MLRFGKGRGQGGAAHVPAWQHWHPHACTPRPTSLSLACTTAPAPAPQPPSATRLRTSSHTRPCGCCWRRVRRSSSTPTRSRPGARTPCWTSYSQRRRWRRRCQGLPLQGPGAWGERRGDESCERPLWGTLTMAALILAVSKCGHCGGGQGTKGPSGKGLGKGSGSPVGQSSPAGQVAWWAGCLLAGAVTCRSACPKHSPHGGRR